MGIENYSSKSIERELARRGIYLIDGKRVDLRGYTLEELEEEVASRLEKSKEYLLPKKERLDSKLQRTPDVIALNGESRSTISEKTNGSFIPARRTPYQEPDPEWLVPDTPDRVDKPKRKKRAKDQTSMNGKREKVTIRRAEEISPPRLNPYDAIPTGDLWKQYKSNPTGDLKKYFMEKYLPLVRLHANKLCARVPTTVDIEDLISEGVFGLVDAIDAFDPERKVKFETYASRRIWGEMLDELRHLDWRPRKTRQSINKLEAIRQEMKKEIGENPSLEKIQEKLGTNDDEFRNIHRYANSKNHISLSQKKTMKKDESSKEVREIDKIKDRKGIDPIDEIQRRDLQGIITKGLERAERLVIVLYYYENMTMKEIGKVLDLTESRVSQIHTNLMNRFKNQMRERGLEDQLAEAANGRQYE